MSASKKNYREVESTVWKIKKDDREDRMVSQGRVHLARTLFDRCRYPFRLVEGSAESQLSVIAFEPVTTAGEK